METFLDCDGFAIEQEQIYYIKKTIDMVALLHDIPDNVSVSLTIVDETEIQEINRQYRGIDSVTDVISFALDEGEEELAIIGGAEEKLLGEIVICYTRAEEQAQEYGHSLQREICYLTAHGMLHLLGYDHMLESDKAQMREQEEKVMAALGLER